MSMADARLPLQPVEEPIICSPYAEPDAHWYYDRETRRAGEGAGTP